MDGAQSRRRPGGALEDDAGVDLRPPGRCRGEGRCPWHCSGRHRHPRHRRCRSCRHATLGGRRCQGQRDGSHRRARGRGQVGETQEEEARRAGEIDTRKHGLRRVQRDEWQGKGRRLRHRYVDAHRPYRPAHRWLGRRQAEEKMWLLARHVCKCYAIAAELGEARRPYWHHGHRGLCRHLHHWCRHEQDRPCESGQSCLALHDPHRGDPGRRSHPRGHPAVRDHLAVDRLQRHGH
mmetsp:Transcript_4495/g.17057  ORF Transcript_4495/g.17057 Transcript_4495/m.17057 type:complete len:235 (-) Transcript_4495:1102-1806(-)